MEEEDQGENGTPAAHMGPRDEDLDWALRRGNWGGRQQAQGRMELIIS